MCKHESHLRIVDAGSQASCLHVNFASRTGETAPNCQMTDPHDAESFSAHLCCFNIHNDVFGSARAERVIKKVGVFYKLKLVLFTTKRPTNKKRQNGCKKTKPKQTNKQTKKERKKERRKETNKQTTNKQTNCKDPRSFSNTTNNEQS